MVPEHTAQRGVEEVRGRVGSLDLSPPSLIHGQPAPIACVELTFGHLNPVNCAASKFLHVQNLSSPWSG